METSSRRQAIIAGGSVGGLMAAALLRAAGWEATVHERSPSSLSGRGGGLVLQGDVLRALRRADIGWTGMPGVTTVERIWLDASDAVVRRAHMPQTQTSWNALYGVLRAAQPDGSMHAGSAVADYTQNEDGIDVRFASGATARADLLVGADGARSSVRARMFPAAAPSYAGYVAWRGLVPERDLPAAFVERFDHAFVFQHGARHQLLAYPVPGADGATAAGARRWNWVWYRRVAAGAALAGVLTDRDGRAHAASLPPGAMPAAQADALRADGRALLAPSLRLLLDATAEPFVQVIADLQAPGMRDGRAVLLGDAAAVVRPHTAAGTAKAAADALALAAALRCGYADAALAAWERERMAAARETGRWGIELGIGMMGAPD
ncbi:FAD binding domain-containing protein [Pseudoduganella lutea]|uniref:2,6-dihydroxypyridine 3-monooxygenase substrate binding domain-containing protein n=1 Tax=Pseudoduganella lutea TaxID=321985 RepID=A0A4P6L3F5_9BURK|nr:FAD-dependent monooxygenase [Pseudoduganella lutea]QBE66110.1 hypothetical protein EWM63_26590 [Pseudoduganella lutea]